MKVTSLPDLKSIERYVRSVKTRCDKRGKQEDNLSPQQRLGLDQLQRRIKDQDLVVVLTDKSGKFAICSKEIYRSLGVPYVKGDREIKNKEVTKIQATLKGHSAMVDKILESGKEFRQQERIRKVHVNKTEQIAPAYVMIKDHKKIFKGSLPSAGL